MKEWFVRLQQKELEACQTPVQVAIFAAIKSYSSNGKAKVALSLRDISRRSKYSIGHIKPVIGELEKLGLVFRHGTVKRFGGQVQVFSVGTPSVPPVDTLKKKGVPPVLRSVPLGNEGVPTTGTKNIQPNNLKPNIKNNLNPLTHQQLWRIAMDLQIPIDRVALKHQTILDKISAKEFKNNNIGLTLRNWLRGDIEKGYLEKLDDIGLMYLESQDPEKQAELNKQIVKAHAEGLI